MKKTNYHPDIRVRLIGSEPFLGPGSAELLKGIQKYGSVAAACENMQISYSKGRRIIRCAEKELGQQIVLRRQGGTGGGQALVTPYGNYILEKFTEFEEKVNHYALQQFDEVLAALRNVEQPDSE